MLVFVTRGQCLYTHHCIVIRALNPSSCVTLTAVKLQKFAFSRLFVIHFPEKFKVRLQENINTRVTKTNKNSSFFAASCNRSDFTVKICESSKLFFCKVGALHYSFLLTGGLECPY